MNPKLEKYIKLIKHPVKKAFKEGYKREEIEAKLREKHWPKEIIDEAIKKVTEKPKLSAARLFITILYWLGILIALSSFYYRQYFFFLIGIGVFLMLLSVPMKISDIKKAKKSAEQAKLKVLPPGYKAVPALAKVVPEIPTAKKSFFSRLFKKKPKVEKPKEVKPEIQKPKKVPEEKRLVVSKAQPKSPSLAAMLAIIPGLGHFYLGKAKKGLIFLLTFWLIIPWIYSIIDAYQSAKEYNKKLPPPSEIKKQPEVKKKKKSKLALIIILIISLAVIAGLTYIYMQGKISQENLAAYATVVVLVSLILMFIARKSGKKGEKRKEDEEKLPEKKVELEQLKKDVSKKATETETDFDKLHKIVEKYGRIKISDIAETFNISKQEAEEWASILEQHNLATIYYPAIGGPEIVRVKKQKKEEEESGEKKNG